MNTAPAPELLAHLRQRLSRREAELAVLLRHCNFAQAEGEEATDFKELADHAAIAAVEDAQASRAVAELAEIRAARKRMSEGEYGVCIECGDAIDRKRLEALPATAYCTDCRQSHEGHGHAHQGA